MLSTLEAAGREAQQIAVLFWVMAAGAAVIWGAMVALALYAASERRARWTVASGYRLITIGGVLLPTVVLAALLAYGLPSLTQLLAAPATPDLSIAVAGEQWWWRVRYDDGLGAKADVANEIRVPAGARVSLSLTSDNVIHSFWIPSLAGKVDMIPGRTTRLSFEATRIGRYRGVCAEYCGASHALMGFTVEVMEPGAFAAWRAAQAADAAPPADAQAARGQELFTRHGCGACHTIRGTSARGAIGPDLTHVGSRPRLAAAALPNEAGAMAQWIAAPERAKPGVHMPGYRTLAAADLDALAAYLGGLR